MSEFVGKDAKGNDLFRIECGPLHDAIVSARDNLQVLDDIDEYSPIAFCRDDVAGLLTDLEFLQARHPDIAALTAVHRALAKHRVEMTWAAFNPITGVADDEHR